MPTPPPLWTGGRAAVILDLDDEEPRALLNLRAAANKPALETRRFRTARAAVARFAAQSQANCGTRPDHLNAV